MISTKNSRSLLYTNQSSVVGGFHELFWRWSSLEKTSKKYHTHSSRHNAFSKCIHQQPRKSSSLSNPSPSKPTSAIESTDTPIDTPLEAPNKSPELNQLALDVRQVMRHVPHSVVILTTPNIHPNSGEPSIAAAAMTLSSFTTLTLSPEPIITFNIKRPSRTLDALKALYPIGSGSSSAKDNPERWFHIHLLEANTSGAQLANHFSRGGPMLPEDRKLVYSPGAVSNVTTKGIRQTFQCEILRNHENSGFIDVGDHTLVFGKMMKIGFGEQADKVKGRKKEWRGLCYMQGQYQIAIPMLHADKKKDVTVSGNGVGGTV
ncbi:putative flavin reductase like domain-containing protein [Botrytis fragariae]|uniref:Putative flavin reductase like domain-containing protein n=1 Tax=Botrytis fragariae TaxID=1964551 RepID=A0A8H6ATL9_9HELO|nr:putative flavin reductase like domain-containing protein [Botrytis fragariae]KAF5873402.1 putative flavin reductase like domain-containing protein [Botrytis fragariae]